MLFILLDVLFILLGVLFILLGVAHTTWCNVLTTWCVVHTMWVCCSGVEIALIRLSGLSKKLSGQVDRPAEVIRRTSR